MAHIRKREGRWQARYRAPDGRERARTFDRKVDAERWLNSARGQLAKGDWVDPAAGRATFGAFAAEWKRTQVLRDSTAEQIDSHLRVHILPAWADRTIASITRGDVQEWVTELADRAGADALAPSYVEGIYRRFASIMAAAVDDRVIGATPCRRIQLPERPHRQVAPLPHETIGAIAEAMPDRVRAVALAAAGSGLRQGELLGLTVDRVDFLRRTIRVDRQAVTVTGAGPRFGPPKTKASVRTVPVGEEVIEVLAGHLAQWPPGDDGLVFANKGRMWRRNRFGELFGSARDAAGTPSWVRFHDLRHFYASVLIEAGEGPHVIKERLGHASITETFDTYGHLFPAAEDRTRSASDAAMRLLRPAVEPRSSGGLHSV